MDITITLKPEEQLAVCQAALTRKHADATHRHFAAVVGKIRYAQYTHQGCNRCGACGRHDGHYPSCRHYGGYSPPDYNPAAERARRAQHDRWLATNDFSEPSRDERRYG